MYSWQKEASLIADSVDICISRYKPASCKITQVQRFQLVETRTLQIEDGIMSEFIPGYVVGVILS